MSDVIKEAEFDEDVFEAMLSGTFEPNENEDEADAAEDSNEDDSEHQEDTDQEDESEDDDETNQDSDGDAEDTYESEDGDEEEDALVGDSDLDDESGDVEDEADEASEDDTTDESEDSTDTEEQSDGKTPATDTVDYKAFYDAVTNAEFTVNGKKVKGFKDPQKIIQSQQMAGGFSEKMAGFKQYRPFMAPLKERGMLDDQAKFNLAMNLVDGDKEAIKLHLKTLNIDPMDLDMDTIDYSGKSAIASQESLIIEDVMERAKSSGIEDRVRQVVGTDWDVDSFNEFVKNPAVRNDLLTHIETGVYDVVQDKIAELSRLDYSGTYGAMNTIGKYREAVKALQEEASTKPQAVKEVPVVPAAPKKANVAAEKDKIAQARKEREYKAKAAEEEAKRMAQRKRATSSSKGKVAAKPKAKFDPMEAEGEDLDNLMDFLISGGR